MRNDITVKQGDVLEFDADIKTEACADYELEEGENLWFVVSQNDTDVLQKIQPDKHFDFGACNLPLGTYRTELGIILADGKEKTLMQARLFVEERLYDE